MNNKGKIKSLTVGCGCKSIVEAVATRCSCCECKKCECINCSCCQC